MNSGEKRHEIDLSALVARGKVKTRTTGSGLDMRTTQSITPVSFNLCGDTFKRHHLSLPGKYRLPFRIDMTVKLDHPSLFLFVGKGHVVFASNSNRKIEDIAFPSGKPNQFNSKLFNDDIPFDEWVDISVTYGLDETQIIINGEERFYSRKFTYMRKKNLPELLKLNAGGFAVGLSVSKLSVLSIKSVTVTEYEEAAPIERGKFDDNMTPETEERPKLTFESVIALLPKEYQDEIIATDSFFKSLRPMRFRRAVDKSGGKISWIASDHGISYHVEPYGERLSHRFGWYIVTNGKPDTWGRKCDYMEDTLRHISKSDPKLAERVFYALNDCVSCYGERCLAKTLYGFDGQKRLACHGLVVLRMSHDDFSDAREFFRYLNAYVTEKAKE